MEQRTIALFAAVISGVAECPGAPSGVVYAAMMTKGYSYADYTDAIHAAIASGLMRQDGFQLTLTPKGKALADRINQVIHANG